MNADYPLINYQVAGVMEPTTLIGAIFGVMMNQMFPAWLILVLLVSLLSYITYKTVLKGNKVRLLVCLYMLVASNALIPFHADSRERD